jgi:hypothetical protein
MNLHFHDALLLKRLGQVIADVWSDHVSDDLSRHFGSLSEYGLIERPIKLASNHAKDIIRAIGTSVLNRSL